MRLLSGRVKGQNPRVLPSCGEGKEGESDRSSRPRIIRDKEDSKGPPTE